MDATQFDEIKQIYDSCISTTEVKVKVALEILKKNCNTYNELDKQIESLTKQIMYPYSSKRGYYDLFNQTLKCLAEKEKGNLIIPDCQGFY